MVKLAKINFRRNEFNSCSEVWDKYQLYELCSK